jgi:hypothetical protein
MTMDTLPLGYELIGRATNLPEELYQKVKSEVNVVMGDTFWDVVLKGIEMTGTFSYGVDQKSCVEILKLHGFVEHEGVDFDDEFVTKLGDGFCYLTSIPIEKRPDCFKFLQAYPTLQHLFMHHEQDLLDFHIIVDSDKFCHLEPGIPRGFVTDAMKFVVCCDECGCVGYALHWSSVSNKHFASCASKAPFRATTTPLAESHLNLRVGGFMDMLSGRRKDRSSGHKRNSSSKSITDSSKHEDKQVVGFQKSVKGDGVEPDMSRDLFSVPKPEEVETMTDHLSRHKVGDMFPYLAVVGNEEESKESRLSRLRAFKSPYGKENKPEMRINGIILDEIEGTILVEQLRDHVNKDRLTRDQAKENKRFRPLSEASFKKPYLLVSRITGEYVPLMSSTADYTDLYFTLEDGRLLDHQTIVQSDKIPSNQNGVFELSCDYCINVKDLNQLSLKYFLARPVMKDGFQWGSVSLTIRMSESDTPFLIPKVEAMAIIRAPYTTLEEHDKDPDHADVVFTSGQIPEFREMYRSGDIVDVDQPKVERTKRSSYSKSSIRGAVKGEAGPSHLAGQPGWEHLKDMRKPLLPEGIASVSAKSDEDDVDEISATPMTRQRYEKEQEEMRKQFESQIEVRNERRDSGSTEDIPDMLRMSEAIRSLSSSSERNFNSIDSIGTPKSSLKRQLRFAEPEKLVQPNTDNVYQFN